MYRTFGFGRRAHRRRRRDARWSDFDWYRSNFWFFIPYNPKTGVEDVDDDDDEYVPEQVETVLKVRSIDLDVVKNTKSHRTNEFDITEGEKELLVVRRGQPFDMKINFNRAYNAKEDDLRLAFSFGRRPLPSKGTHVEFILSDEDIPKKWGAFIKSKEENSLNVTIMTPPTCFVGKWSLKVYVVKKGNKKKQVYQYEHSDPIYMLFNPWCKDDQVYMEQEKLLDEYVLCEDGKIYRGSARRISPCAWNHDQFSSTALDCVMYLLDKKSKIPDHCRGDPVQVSRAISSLVNGCDNGGILEGNWSGDYEGGTSPLAWSGSGAILEKYYRDKKTVKFGQCWVFSAVVTTVCRTLGIPVRSVTNFASAHDTDGSITIDSHFDMNGEPLEDFNDDSVWNFHVWNDVWMARPDLPEDYGGWQAIDATPQESSGGIYCMGPMSLKAIKNGDVYLPYDGHFVFAEVNADRAQWCQDENGDFQLAKIYGNRVGKYISTKVPSGQVPWLDYRINYCPQREDITNQYKHNEGSDEERLAVGRANLNSTNKAIYKDTEGDVTFELNTYEETFIGETMKICLKMKNTGAYGRTVSGAIKVVTIHYTGVPHKDMLKHKIEKGSIVLKANEEKCVNLEVPVEDYLDKLADHCNYKVSCMCVVAETKQVFTDINEERLRKPHLNIKAPDKGCVGKKCEVEVSFENPLPVTLTKCILHIEGLGNSADYKPQNVNAKQTLTHTFEMCPKKPGKRQIVVTFNCVQLAAIDWSVPINITK